MRKSVVVMLALGVALVSTALWASQETPVKTEKAEANETVRSQVVRVDKWKLYQSSGKELYREMCASCHGQEGAGRASTVGVGGIPAPPLNTGVEHWWTQ